MKFPSFGSKKNAAAKETAKPTTVDKHATDVKKQAAVKPLKTPGEKKPSAPVDGKKQIVAGFGLIAVAFAGVIFLFYVNVNAQSAKEAEVKDLKQHLALISTEKEILDRKSDALEKEIGRVLDLDKVIKASEEINEGKETDRKEGSLWINRKTSSYLVTLGALNGVTKGSRLAVYDGDNKFTTVKVTMALDVVAYVEPIDKKSKDFLKDYYTVKVE